MKITTPDGKYTFEKRPDDWRIHVSRFDNEEWATIEAGSRAVLALMRLTETLADRLYKNLTDRGWDAYVPRDEFDEVLGADRRLAIACDTFIGWVQVLDNQDEIYEIREDEFTPSGDGTTPDFDNIEIIDHGQTLRFGKYEVSVSELLENR